ncbi:hypothetical protein [Lysobacter gummosus]|uniref:hypothetical protein n=1 Tax=Lysobacter gummosus TaxID=262324 RepID=UPI0036422A7D
MRRRLRCTRSSAPRLRKAGHRSRTNARRARAWRGLSGRYATWIETATQAHAPIEPRFQRVSMKRSPTPGSVAI